MVHLIYALTHTALFPWNPTLVIKEFIYNHSYICSIFQLIQPPRWVSINLRTWKLLWDSCTDLTCSDEDWKLSPGLLTIFNCAVSVTVWMTSVEPQVVFSLNPLCLGVLCSVRYNSAQPFGLSFDLSWDQDGISTYGSATQWMFLGLESCLKGKMMTLDFDSGCKVPWGLFLYGAAQL